jgi:putative glycosyltransferase (TIGR04348 family)
MKITIATPAPVGSRKGNRITAVRWARLLRELGHRVRLMNSDDKPIGDLLIALHAHKSAAAVFHFRARFPQRPIVLALTGTDLYSDLHTSVAAQQALQLADRLLLLQSHGINELPSQVRDRARVIYQSVRKPNWQVSPHPDRFDVCVVGHLRPVKDPFRTAEAARLLPAHSRLRVWHLGAALSDDMAELARFHEANNPRYRWLGELPRSRTLRRMARSRLLVLTSQLEGGANVISEAVVLGVPVLSSRISGSLGLLGEDYPGYFPVGDTRELANLLLRAETDSSFLADLSQRCRQLADRFHPSEEKRRWQKLLAELDGPPP